MSGNGSANGNKKRSWDLATDGILWKKVLHYSSKEFQTQAEAFVAQLQESAKPADALEGLLLDRMAASYLRKRVILEAEGQAKEYYRYKRSRELANESEALRAVHIAADVLIYQAQTSNYTLKYEALLDQGFHRDLILLQKLKEIASVPDRPEKKSLKTERRLIEDGTDVISQ